MSKEPRVLKLIWLNDESMFKTYDKVELLHKQVIDVIEYSAYETLTAKVKRYEEALTSIASLSKPRHDDAKYWQGLSREQCAIVVAKDTQIARAALNQGDDDK